VVGCNPFYGAGHFNRTLDLLMSEWYTSERVRAALARSNEFGINAYNFAPRERAAEDLERFRAQGGRMHLIVQGLDAEPRAAVERYKPLAIYRMGDAVDRAFQFDMMGEVREWCRKARDLGVMVGVGTHKPEVIALVEEQGWDVDFYAGCVYNRTRTPGEWRQVLNGEMPEMANEIYLESDPPRMYKTMRQTRKPCFAFKILAAGRIPEKDVDRAFRTAFESIKPGDGLFVGTFPKFRDEVKENAERVCRILARA
jgi:hypothetical protein